MLSEPHTEDLIREALHAQAGRAPSTAAVFEGIDTTRAARTRRTRTAGLATVAAAVVAVAVVIPLALHAGGGSGDGTVAIAAGAQQPRGFAPGWVPSGWVTTNRVLDSGKQSSQMWQPRGEKPVPGADWVTLSTATTQPPLPGKQDRPPQSVTIDGAQGTLESGPVRVLVSGKPVVSKEMVQVSWQPKPGTWLTVRIEEKQADPGTVLRMARSVTAVTTGTDVPFTFGFLPPDAEAGDIPISGTPTVWTAGEPVLVLNVGRPRHIEVDAYWGPGVPAPWTGNSKPVALSSGRGYYQDNRPPGNSPAGVATSSLSTRIDGSWLIVRAAGDVSEADMVKIADTMTFHPNVDYSWLGKP